MAVCKHCHMYKTHGKNCWYYWEEKKMCSQFKLTAEDEPKVVSEDHINIE